MVDFIVGIIFYIALFVGILWAWKKIREHWANTDRNA